MPFDPRDAFTVDFRSMDSCAGAIRQASKLIDDVTNDLEGRVSKALAYWEASSKEAYNTAKRNWDQACREMNQVLNQSSKGMGNILENYIRTEGVNTALFTNK